MCCVLSRGLGGLSPQLKPLIEFWFLLEFGDSAPRQQPVIVGLCHCPEALAVPLAAGLSAALCRWPRKPRFSAGQPVPLVTPGLRLAQESCPPQEAAAGPPRPWPRDGCEAAVVRVRLCRTWRWRPERRCPAAGPGVGVQGSPWGQPALRRVWDPGRRPVHRKATLRSLHSALGVPPRGGPRTRGTSRARLRWRSRDLRPGGDSAE